MAVVPMRPNTMPKEEFQRRLADWRNTYGPNKKTAAARSEQVLSGIFDETGWTQEEIAAEAGLSQHHVSRLLTFGRFLAFIPTGINADYTALHIPLTENRFRKFWSATKDMAGNDRRRYAETWKAILAADQDEAAGGRKRPRDFGAMRAELASLFGDGKWHPAARIAESLETDETTLAECIAGAGKFRLKDFPYHIENKTVGTERHYRLLSLDRQLSLQKALEELRPILKGFEEQAKQSRVQVSISAIARLSNQLRALMRKWEEGSPVLETPDVLEGKEET